MTRSVVSLFSGGGIKTLGAVQAGYTPVLGVEMSPEIAAVYSDNIGAVSVAKVEDVDPRPYAGIDLLLASPVCTNASVANAGRGERGTDMAAAEGVCRWLREARPERFVMENVTQYREFDSCKSILNTLTELGYWWSADNCNFASLGVPQTRKRLIVRATRDAMLPPLPAPTPWIGWYAAIEDILHTLPESRFAPWQLARLPSDPFESVLTRPCRYGPEERGKGFALASEPAATVMTQGGQQRALLVSNGGAHGALFRLPGHPAPAVTGQSEGRVRGFLVSDNTEASGERVGVPHSHAPAGTVRAGGTGAKAFLVAGDAKGPDRIDCREGVSRAYTLTANMGDGRLNTHRAWLEQGRVVALTPRALARLQTLPDTYRLPESRRLACQIIGNGFSTEAARRIIGGLS